MINSSTVTNLDSSEFDIESSFIRKVLAKLMKEQFITTIGGRYGGYKLLVEPSHIIIYDVYLALVQTHFNHKNSDLLAK
ncbi:MAG: Rrf2 family transcriptional regulator [Candidatus Pristimantibacillus sp.]